ncbi:MAG: hypothetical protein AB7D51_07725 [Desulfovibrionaceae bacterium]
MDIEGTPPEREAHQGILGILAFENDRLLPLGGISELRINNEQGRNLPWEEGSFILSQALSTPPGLLPALPSLEYKDLPLPGGEHFLLPDAFLAQALLSLADPADSAASVLALEQNRAQLYKNAALQALALIEARRFDNRLDNLLTTSLEGGGALLGLAGTGLDAWMLLQQHTRTAESSRLAVQYSGSAAGVAEKVEQRIRSSKLGKGSGLLSYLTLGLELAAEVSNRQDRNAFLAALANDLLAMRGLETTLELMEKAGDTDPAMVLGLSDALDEIQQLGRSRLRQYADSGLAGFGRTLPSLGVLAAGKLLGMGPGLVIQQTMELKRELDAFEQGALTVGALLTMTTYLNSRVEHLESGGTVGRVGATDIQVREAAWFYDKLAAEASATVYSMVFRDSFLDYTSLAGLGKKLGLSIASAVARLRDKGVTAEEYAAEVENRTAPVRAALLLGPSLDAILPDLQKRYKGDRTAPASPVSASRAPRPEASCVYQGDVQPVVDPVRIRIGPASLDIRTDTNVLVNGGSAARTSILSSLDLVEDRSGFSGRLKGILRFQRISGLPGTAATQGSDLPVVHFSVNGETGEVSAVRTENADDSEFGRTVSEAMAQQLGISLLPQRPVVSGDVVQRMALSDICDELQGARGTLESTLCGLSHHKGEPCYVTSLRAGPMDLTIEGVRTTLKVTGYGMISTSDGLVRFSTSEVVFDIPGEGTVSIIQKVRAARR